MPTQAWSIGVTTILACIAGRAGGVEVPIRPQARPCVSAIETYPRYPQEHRRVDGVGSSQQNSAAQFAALRSSAQSTTEDQRPDDTEHRPDVDLIRAFVEHMRDLSAVDDLRRHGYAHLARSTDHAKLAAMSQTGPTSQRIAAIIQLGRLGVGNDQTLLALSNALDDTALRTNAMSALRRIGDGAVPTSRKLVDLLDSPDALVRTQARTVLNNIADVEEPDSGGISDDEYRAMLSAHALCFLWHDTVEEREAVELLRDGSPSERIGAASLFALKKYPRAIHHLETALSDAEPRVRVAILQALDKLGASNDETTELLLHTMLESADAEACIEAALALGNVNVDRQPAIEGLKRAQKDQDDRVRVSAARSLWRLNRDPSSIHALSDALSSERSDVRWQAAIALGQCGQDASHAVPQLKASAREADRVLAYLIGEALSKIGDENCR